VSWTPKVQHTGGSFATSGGQAKPQWTPESSQIGDPFVSEGSGEPPEVKLDGVTTIRFESVEMLPAGSEPQIVNTGTPNRAVLHLKIPASPGGEGGGSVPIASETTAGIVRVGHGLQIDRSTGVLTVDTADKPEADNTLPITSAAVDASIGNIAILLSTI
jgi:hypothetical protein